MISRAAERYRPLPRPRQRWHVTLAALLVLIGHEAPRTVWGQEPGDQPPASRLVELSLAAKERERLRELATRARDRLAVLTREAQRLAGHERSVSQELRALDVARERHALEEAAAAASGRVARAEAADTAERIAAAEAAAAARAPAVRARVRRLYQLGPLDTPRYWIRPEGLTGTGRAWRLLAALAAEDRATLADAAEDRAELARLYEEQQRRVAEADRLGAAAAAARAAAAQTARAREALLARLGRERELADRLVGELRQAESDLAALLARPMGTAAPGEAGDATPALALSAFKGALTWPATGQMVAAFGRARQSRFGTVLPRNGIEIAAPQSSAVAAVHDGRVAFADQFAGYGRLVIVDHGRGAFSLYGHLGSMDVTRGTPVSRGTRLGSVGQTPAGAEAVYFELRIDGKPVNPLEWLQPATARRSRP